MNTAEILSLLKPGGRYEVREFENFVLLVIYIEEAPVTVVNMSADQATHLSNLLAMASDRVHSKTIDGVARKIK